jgi:ComF family protein
VILKTAFDAVASILLPAPCRICRLPLVTASRLPVCRECLASFVPIPDPICECCGRPLPTAYSSESSARLCHLCRTDFFAFTRARSFAVYNEALVQAILLLKYEQVGRLGDWFAAQLADVVGRNSKTYMPDVVVPVPLHAARLRERGYNQAELIAGPLARRLGLKLGPYLLVRTVPRPPKLHLSRSERWKSVRGAYAIREGLRVDNLRVLLVDDVMTSGATLDACARALKRAGAAEVLGITVGRAVSGWPASPFPSRRG